MKLQARFLILFLALFGVVGMLLYLQYRFDNSRSTILLKNELSQNKTYFTRLQSMDGEGLKTMSVDYSFWDDMVDFVKTRNPEFARDNIDTGVSTYGADAAWVFNGNGSLVYFAKSDNGPKSQQLNLPAEFFSRLRENKFDHFYHKLGDELLEIRAATIHPGDDSERLTPPQGFWLVGRQINQEHLSNLEEISQNQITLAGATSSPGDALGTDSVSFAVTLKDWDGQVQARMQVESAVPVVGQLRSLYMRQLALLLSCAMATVMLLIGAVWYMVLAPLRTINMSLSRHDPAPLDKLARQSTEVGALAQTVQQFFAQEGKLREKDFLKAKLVELNQAKSEFLAIAAHELKGSVGNVHLFARNLVEIIDTNPTKDIIKEELKRITHQTRKATVLINDIYQASKGGQSLTLNRTEFDFDDFVREEIADAQYSTKQSIKLIGFTAAHITSDRDRLSQVMSNLIRNASKYSPLAKEIRVNLKRQGNNVVVAVEDEGIGISPADQTHVFERFFRSQDVAAHYPGLGLGLSICKEIVEALGGKIWFTTEQGKGSQFYVSLPVSAESTELS